ncbi:MAG TPA: septal ring lytic transglycosylase RlpA family protein [Trueperaceae bacterium]|nr:septal ring lytic transglycosylase RlpA family protein [Trueperaceae bacterium]
MHARGVVVSRRSPVFSLLGLALALAACAPAVARSETTPTAFAVETEAPSFTVQEGKASWYGPGFAGRRTANGEVFDPSQLTAAHRELPFDTLVRVHNLQNGRSVVVRINDRGPFKGGRVIDLSRAAAEAIGMLGSGVADVKLEVLSVPSGMVRVAAYPQLKGYEAISRHHRVGTLLVLDRPLGGKPIVVRVVGQEVPAGVPADLLLAFDLFAVVGAQVTVLGN